MTRGTSNEPNRNWPAIGSGVLTTILAVWLLIPVTRSNEDRADSHKDRDSLRGAIERTAETNRREIAELRDDLEALRNGGDFLNSKDDRRISDRIAIIDRDVARLERRIDALTDGLNEPRY